MSAAQSRARGQQWLTACAGFRCLRSSCQGMVAPLHTGIKVSMQRLKACNPLTLPNN